MCVEHCQKEGVNSNINALENGGKKYKARTAPKVIAKGIIKQRRLLIRKITGARMFKRWLAVCGNRKEELIYKARLILRFKRRIRVVYDKKFALLDAYFRKRVRFIYKEKKDGEFTGKILKLNLYQHREKQNDIKIRAAFNSLEKKFVEEVFTGETTIKTDPWYINQINLLNDIDCESRNKRQLLDYILDELEKLGLFKDVPYNDVFSEERSKSVNRKDYECAV